MLHTILCTLKYSGSLDLDITAKIMQYDLGLHCLSFNQCFLMYHQIVNWTFSNSEHYSVFH